MTQNMALRSAMEGVVEELQLTNTNYLTHNRVYSTLGSNGALAVEPAVLHFGGFELGKTLRATLRVVNVSPVSQRLHLVPPTTPHFVARIDSKKGQLAPGMAEDVVVEFTPKQWRYYYDCVRVHCEPENLMVPIHAYPVMNTTKFPSRIDFGNVAVGDAKTRRVKLDCRVPIEFEFKVRELRANPCFKVSPASGIVPAHGSAEVEVTFTPALLRTEETTIEVSVAEFNSQPVLCTVTGSSLPGIHKGSLLKETLGTDHPDMADLDGKTLMREAKKRWPINKGGGTVGGGAGGGDAYTVMQMTQRKEAIQQRDCRVDGPIQLKLPVLAAGPGETELGGVFVPNSSLTTMADLAYVLNQQPGKLRIKDIKEAITGKKAELSQQSAELGSIMAEGLGAGVHPLERPEVPAHIKAALFKQLLSQAEEEERKVILGGGVRLGEGVMAAEEIAEQQRQREQQHRLHQAAIEADAKAALTARLQPNGAEHRLDRAENGADAFTPEWRLVEANDWKKRVLALQRFTRAVHTVVYRQRLERRYDKIHAFLTQVNFNKQRIAEETANPVLLVSESDRPGEPPTKHLDPAAVRMRPLPLYRDVNFMSHDPVDASHYTDFDELSKMCGLTPIEYKILGYETQPYPGLTPYAPLLEDTPLLLGATEEDESAPGPSGVVDMAAPQYAEGLPEACLQAPYIMLEVGNRYSEDSVYAQLLPSWGMPSPAERVGGCTVGVQPCVLPVHDSTTHEPLAVGSAKALRVAPLLCERWLPRRDTWAQQLCAEYVPALLRGPDAADLLADRPDDADKPALLVVTPSAELLARYVPPASAGPVGGGFGGAGGAAGRAGGATPAQGSGSGDGVGAGAGEASAEEQWAASAASRRGKLPYELSRQRRQDEVDGEKGAAHVAAISAVEAALTAYNKTLLQPSRFAAYL